jgi:hypothetical protein
MRPETVSRSERLPAEVASRVLRRLYFYRVEDAGVKLGLSRSQAYIAARNGIIPTERYGKLLLVPRQRWDRVAKRLLRGPKLRSPRKLRRAKVIAGMPAIKTAKEFADDLK